MLKIAVEKSRPSSSQLITGVPLAPLIMSLTTQVPDQWIFTGSTPDAGLPRGDLVCIVQKCRRGEGDMLSAN